MSAAPNPDLPSRPAGLVLAATLFSSPHLIPLCILALLSFVSTWFLLSNLDPTQFPDTAEYERLASALLQGNLSEFYFRTPGYPMFLAVSHLVFGKGLWVVAAIQVILSVTVPYFLYGIFFLITRCKWIAALSAGVYFTFWDCQALSIAVLTESLTQLFLLASTFFGVLVAIKPAKITAVVLGIALACLLMIRPAFLPLFIAFAAIIALVSWREKRLKATLTSIAIVTAIPFVATFLWCGVVKRHTGSFTISHITGVALLNQVSDQLTDLQASPDPEIVEILKSGIQANGGDHLNVGWLALKRQRDAGVPEWITADRLKALSVWLIKKNPKKFLQKIGSNTREYISDTGKYIFTSSKTYDAMLAVPVFGHIYRALDLQFRLRPGRLMLLFVLTTTLSVVVMFLPGIPIQTRLLYLFPWAGIGNCMLGHILVNGADLGRYNMPAQALYLATAICTFYLVISGLRRYKPRLTGAQR